MDDKKKKKPTQSPFETLTQADRSLFDLVWKTFENGVSQEVCPPCVSMYKFLRVSLWRMQNSTEYGAMYQLASEMDFDQMATMLDALQSALVKDVPGSVHFALLLDFKCKILQCCLRLWPLQRFKDILYILHPIECVCTHL